MSNYRVSAGSFLLLLASSSLHAGVIGAAWARLRDAFLRENPLCADCLERGLYEPATEVHHIWEVAEFPELRLDWSDLRALSHACSLGAHGEGRVNASVYHHWSAPNVPSS